MKWKNIMFCLTAILLSSFLFSACQRDPDEKVVISKNDGAFDAGIVVSADKNILLVSLCHWSIQKASQVQIIA